MGSVRLRLKEQHGITLEIDEQVKELLWEKGYKPEYGARELRRVVERELEMKLAEKMLMLETILSDLQAIQRENSIVIVSNTLK